MDAACHYVKERPRQRNDNADKEALKARLGHLAVCEGGPRGDYKTIKSFEAAKAIFARKGSWH